jgi:NTP pyrophosphatase (non-canonical NTP hydrolase)
MPIQLDQFQSEVEEWAKLNFGPLNWRNALMGIAEENGELNHALLKREQGIRGGYDEHTAKAKDAVGDLVVFIANFCGGMGWSLDEIVGEVWAQVKQRDWKQNPHNGLAPALPKSSEPNSRDIATAEFAPPSN